MTTRSFSNEALIDAGLALLPAPTGINYTGIEIARMARIEKLGMHQRLRPAAAVVEAVKAAIQTRRDNQEGKIAS